MYSPAVTRKVLLWHFLQHVSIGQTSLPIRLFFKPLYISWTRPLRGKIDHFHKSDIFMWLTALHLHLKHLSFPLSVQTQRDGLIFIYDMTNSTYANFDYELCVKILNLLKVSVVMLSRPSVCFTVCSQCVHVLNSVGFGFALLRSIKLFICHLYLLLLGLPW